MRTTLLATTSTEGLQPLGSPAQRSYELVSAAVAARLGPEHAALFAEPVASPHGDRIDWHAPLAGEAVTLDRLDTEERAALEARLARLAGEIRAEAETLRDAPLGADQRLGEALLNALEIPGPAMLRAVRGADGALHPVLMHWAWTDSAQRAPRGVLSRMEARPGAAAPLPPPPPRAGAPAILWWLILLGWLVLAALLAAIVWVLIAPCGLSQGRLIFCPAAPEPLAAAYHEAARASDRTAALERELALVDRSCHPTVPIAPAAAPEPAPEAPPAAPPAAAPEDKTDAGTDAEAVEKRLAERGAARGALNFALAWATRDDIDLSVTCPTGATVSYLNTAECDGAYDLDANVLSGEAIEDPVENIVFTEARPGLYQVRAHLKSERTDGMKEVVLHVLRPDGPPLSYKGMVGSGRDEWRTNISISR